MNSILYWFLFNPCVNTFQMSFIFIDLGSNEIHTNKSQAAIEQCVIVFVISAAAAKFVY